MLDLSFKMKRVFDFATAGLSLIILFPLFVIIGILIKLDSKGPVFFKQRRLGKNGRPFLIIKFRTMILNAEKLGEGLRVSSEKDPRITRVGGALRASSLDELPQLINVIRGEMSLVGPRPPATYYPYDGYENYPEWAKKRFEVLPGLTGLAQVTVRNSAEWDERIRIDLEYIENISFLLDFKILGRTAIKIFSSENIYF